MRKLDVSEYDKQLYYKNNEFWDLMVTYDFEPVTEEKETEIIKYLDVPHLFNGIDERIAELSARADVSEQARTGVPRRLRNTRAPTLIS